MTTAGAVSLSWAAVYLAFLATPAFCFHLGSRVSPYYHRTFTGQPILYFSGYILVAVTLNLGVVFLWDLLGLRPDTDLVTIFQLFERVPNAKDIQGNLRPIVAYGLIVNIVGLAAGVGYKWVLVQLYRHDLLVSWAAPAHRLAYTVVTWGREPFQRPQYRFVVCHVLSKITTEVVGGRHRIVYRGVFWDAEAAPDGGLGTLTIAYPEKFLLAMRSGDLADAGAFDRFTPDTQLLMQLRHDQIENILYEFVEAAPGGEHGGIVAAAMPTSRGHW